MYKHKRRRLEHLLLLERVGPGSEVGALLWDHLTAMARSEVWRVQFTVGPHVRAQMVATT